MNQELELYKLCVGEHEESKYVSELGWVSDEEFLVWISYLWVDDFMRELKRIFGYGIFDDGSFDANMQSDGICIDLCKAVGCCLDVEEVFPKAKYQH